MHISEGIITGIPTVGYTVAAAGLVAFGAKKMKDFVKEHPKKKTLLGMAGAFIFFLSLLPIPAFTGTCSHPCGTPLAGIILGPWIGIALAGLSLLLQAAFFAHGGFSTWGANVIILGVGGALFGWTAFKISRKAGLSLFISAAIGGLIGDIMTYIFAGLALGTTLAYGPTPQYSLSGYLIAIFTAYLPTQGPIALGEMIVTGWIISFIHKQRPEILESLKVTSAMALIVAISTFMLLFPTVKSYADSHDSPVLENLIAMEEGEETGGIAGMDEAVNEKLAKDGGKPPRDPYINLEALGDVWNMILLLGGGICGFILGVGWNKMFGKNKK